MATSTQLLTVVKTITSYSKHGIEACGKHPFITGLFAILGIVGLVLSVVDFDISRDEANETTIQIDDTKKEILHGIRKSTETIVQTLLEKHQHDLQSKNEQIKALTQAVMAISSKTELIGSKNERDAALIALTKGDIKQAKQLFLNTIEKGEQEAQRLAENYQNLGALAFLDNTQQALHAYKRATELNSNDIDSWNMLGHLYRRTGEMSQAISAYNKALDLAKKQQNNPKISMSYDYLGIVYQTLGELGKAIEFHQKALAINEALGREKGMAGNETVTKSV